MNVRDEVGAVAALLMGPDGGFVTGSDFLMDGGLTAAYWYVDVGEVRTWWPVSVDSVVSSGRSIPAGGVGPSLKYSR